MVARRGEIWWANLPRPTGSGPGFRRPVVIAQSDAFNASVLSTVVVAIVTSNLLLGNAPGNIVLPRRHSRLKRKSVINVSQLFTIDKALLSDRISRLSDALIHRLDDGLKLVLSLK